MDNEMDNETDAMSEFEQTAQPSENKKPMVDLFDNP
jgi:hypothetical protein